jgi:hypothetical protein
MTPAAPPAFLRTAVLRIFWDDEASPSVEAPFGDFFCAGECSPRRVGPANLYHPRRTSNFNPQMDAWYRLGSAIISSEKQTVP